MRALLLLLLVAGCESRGIFKSPEASLERMIDQPRVDPYEHSTLFPDHRAMRPPVEGTVPYGEPIDPKVELGMDGGAYLADIPLAVDLPLVERGRGRYQIFCAVCHGQMGDAQTAVAEQMQLVKPRSLIADQVRGLPPGRIYRVIRDGYGLMPSYSPAISTRDRWAIVAYVQALQLAARARLSDLPAEIEGEAQQELK